MVHRIQNQCQLHGPHQPTAETARNQDGAQRRTNRDVCQPVYGRKECTTTLALAWKRGYDKGKLNWVVWWESTLCMYEYNFRVRLYYTYYENIQNILLTYKKNLTMKNWVFSISCSTAISHFPGVLIS